MTERPDGGDISSGFGDPTVVGPVSDEKAERMLHGEGSGPDAREPAPGPDAQADSPGGRPDADASGRGDSQP